MEAQSTHSLPDAEFYAALEAAIRTGRSSENIAQQFSIKSASVRKHRSIMRREGLLQPSTIEETSNAQESRASV